MISISLFCKSGSVWPAIMFRVCRPSLVRVKQNIDGKPFRREQIDGLNCFEAPSDLTLPACQEMVCRFQVCLQRYLADPAIRGANVSYKKPGMHVAQVCRSTLHRNRLLIFDKTTTPISLFCKSGSVWPAVMFRVCRPSLVRVKQLMGSHFGGNKLMAWIVLRHLLTWPCQRAKRWCVGFKFVCRGTLQTRSFEVQMSPTRSHAWM